MSSTYGGWNPQDPHRQDPQPFDPYGPRDPYGRPANPYGRPDYEPRQPPEQQAPGYPQQHQAPTAQVPQYSPVPEQQDPHEVGGPPTVGSAWRWAWSAFGASWGTWVVMSVLLGLAQLAVVLVFSPSTVQGLANAGDPAVVDSALAASQTLTAKAVAGGGTALSFLLQALLYAGALAATRTRRVRFRDFFRLRGFGGLVGYAVLTGALGFAGAVVPVAGWLVQVVCTLLLLPVPFLLLKGVRLGAAIGAGVGLVLSHLGTALAVFGIFAGLALASIPTCGLGLVVVAPAILLVGAYLVQRWSGEPVQR